MNDRYFVDTNIIVYSKDLSEPEKQPIAIDWMSRLWHEKTGRISVQVLNEYYVTVTRKLDKGFTQKEAWKHIESFFAWQPLPLDDKLIRKARHIELRHQVSWWDALIVAAAMQTQCNIILTEDLQHGRKINQITIQDPFKESVVV